jgi:hypothetical protein
LSFDEKYLSDRVSAVTLTPSWHEGEAMTVRGYTESERAELRHRLDQLRLRRLLLDGEHLAHEVFARHAGRDTGWVQAWSLIGETVNPLFFKLKDDLGDLTEVSDTQVNQLRKEVYTFAGSRDRLLWEELDLPLKSHQDDYFRGQTILRSIVESVENVLETAEDVLAPGAVLFAGSEALSEKQAKHSVEVLRFIRWGLLGQIAWLLKPSSFSANQAVDKGGAQLQKDVWARGLLRNVRPTWSLPGIALAGRNIASMLFATSGFSASLDDSDPFISLEEGASAMPRQLARKFSGKKSALLEHRESVKALGYTKTGILDNGTSELDRVAIDFIFKAREQNSFFVFAPTSSGKTRLAHMAMFEAIAKRKREDPDALGRVVMLAPTKALVNQIVRDLENLIKGTEARDWQIIAGTRDHPQYNDHLRSMTFDIAVVIPEKLSALLRIGMNLSDCPLIVVDELQHLVEPQRGLELELLMIEIFERHPELRWVGLSASLGRDTRKLLRDWLSTNGSHAPQIDAEYRPVPLSVSATDGKMSLQRETHDTGVPQTDRAVLANLGSAIKQIQVHPKTKELARAYQRPLELMFDVLKKHMKDGTFDPHTTPSILFFVHGRRVARHLAVATQELMHKHLGLREINDSIDKPYTGGRFEAMPTSNPVLTPEEAIEDLNQMPPGRLRRYVTQALTHGVGFHTATLDTHSRQSVEDGFRHGYIRILFATDTLKLGVNLPSDIVINGDMLLSAGDYYRLLDKDSVIQRLGRAGRLGLKLQGLGYIVSPDEFPPSHIGDATIEIGIDERKGLGGRPDAADTAVHKAVRAADKVFDHYLSDWTGGAEYSPKQNNLWLQNAVLWRLGREREPVSLTDLELQAKELHSKTLSGCFGDMFPDGSMRSLLESRAIVQDGDKVRLSARGHALAVNALGAENADTIAKIAHAAAEGAGPLTLFYLAARAPICLRMTYQMSFDLPSTPLNALEGILQVTREALKQKPEGAPRLFRHFGQLTRDVIGAGTIADGLRASLTTNDILGAPGREHATALWRALVLLKRWAGSPLTDIEQIAQSGVPDEVAIQQLGQGVAYAIGAAADMLAIDPSDMTFRTLQNLETEVEIGLPAVLATLVRVNHRSMNRERLLGLLPYLEDPALRWDSLADILQKYFEDTGARPSTNPGRGQRAAKWEPLSPSTVAKVTAEIRKIESDRKRFALSLAQPWAGHHIPRDYELTMAEDLEKVAGTGGLQIICELLEASGLSVEMAAGSPERLIITYGDGDGKESTLLQIARDVVNQATVDEVMATLQPHQNILVIAAAGATHGVVHRSAYRYEACAVVDPSLFFEMIARVYDKNFHEENGFLGSAGQLDMEANARMLRLMLLNNAPVLSRSDLENRLVSGDIAQLPLASMSTGTEGGLRRAES